MTTLRVHEQARRPRRKEDVGEGRGAAVSPPRYGISVVDQLAPSSRPAGRATIQAKKIVGDAGDSYEREADRIADRVADSWSSEHAPPLETSVASAPAVQRLGESGERGAAVSPEFEGRLDAARSGGRPLPAATRAGMESRFGADFSAVRLHTGPTAERLAAQIGAHAFTSGADIFLGAGQGDTSSAAGRHLLAHELTHVVQQGAATRHGGGESVRGGAGTSVIQRRLNEQAKQQLTQKIAIDETAVRWMMYEGDPAREQLEALLDATVDFAHAVRDASNASNQDITVISDMFGHLRTLAPLERGGGYVSLSKAERLMEHYMRTGKVAGSIGNTYNHKALDLEGSELSGFKKGMSHVGGALLNVFMPMTLLSLHGAVGASQIIKMQMSRLLTTLQHDDNRAYSAAESFRGCVGTLGRLVDERVSGRVLELLKKFLKKREAQSDTATKINFTRLLDPERKSMAHWKIYRSLFGSK